MQTGTQEQRAEKTQDRVGQDPIADLIGQDNEEGENRTTGEDAGQRVGQQVRRQVARVRPTPEEINAQIQVSEMTLCVRKDDGLAYEAYAISDGVAHRRWNAEEDTPYDWSLTTDFLREHQVFNFVDNSETARALTSLVKDNAMQKERLNRYSKIIQDTYVSLGKNGRRKMEEIIEPGMKKLLRASIS